MGFYAIRIHDVALFVNSKYFPLVHHRQATAQFHPLMANEVSVATQVSKTRAFKQRRTPLPLPCVCALAFVRVSVWVFACVCMHFCMFVSAPVMRYYVRSCACSES
jgi:hypothetical protein